MKRGYRCPSRGEHIRYISIEDLPEMRNIILEIVPESTNSNSDDFGPGVRLSGLSRKLGFPLRTVKSDPRNNSRKYCYK